MIDLHSHILPGLDDGARDLDDALAIARSAVADGITVVAATPHVREDFPTTADAMEQGVRQLQGLLDRERIGLRVLPGGEISLEQLDRLSHDELRRFSLAGNNRYLLVETPYVEWPMPLEDIVARLAPLGMTPVIAHPERNAAVQSDNAKVAGLVRSGALIQVTAASLDGRLGSRTRACARKLVDLGLAHMIGSDAHTAGVREIGLSTARGAVRDAELAHWLTEGVPGAVARGEELPRRPTPERRPGLLGRLLGR